MRILLDECVPRPLKRELTDYDIRTVVEMGWSDRKNVKLIPRLALRGIALRAAALTPPTLREAASASTSSVRESFVPMTTD